jgi:hypothetical protein
VGGVGHVYRVEACEGSAGARTAHGFSTP